MALIRQSNARDIARDAIVLDLGDLQRQAGVIVSEAQARSAAIAAAARDERARILAGAAEQGRAEGFEAGRTDGHTSGFAEGRAAAVAEFKDRLAAIEAGWEAALTAFQSERDQMVRSAQLDVLRLAIQIGERIAERLVETDPQVVASQLEAVLAVVVRPTELLVRINPDDRPVLADALPRLSARCAQARHVELIDDPAIGRGSCIATTRAASAGPPGSANHDLNPGEIDASIDVQLSRIVEALLPNPPTPPTLPIPSPTAIPPNQPQPPEAA